ncbi:MAG: hypothetical protein A3G18_03850 [Rhodospirillales bacterium RIFCSPLOWO2_12_FULL_58_28]|nr:MAG: hypothetical protein A3H92_01790 [Rhodospirillales bacterium RIFCSPLOWO2_02_FULL_58_16]OHC78106.1 MAG: hypothetical protein A3G18_03850 [Rhodospirillales bacterium RIFCSPLOWO2_12_FULL_58_28]
MANDSFYPRLKAFVIETTGMVFFSDKDEELTGIFSKRFEAVGAGDCAAYLVYLETDKDELDELIAELTIGETYFFRHNEQFDAIRNIVLPRIIRKNQKNRRIRIWSAGCAIGAEPYTLSIILKKEFGAELAGWVIDIVGTDINKKFLAIAKRGRFRGWALRAVSDEIKNECFTPAGQDWTIKPYFTKNVMFRYHNLALDPFPSHLDNLFAFDLILCRNVTIYFNHETIRSIIRKFHECLVDDGWLMVGHSEPNMVTFKAFKSVNAPGTVLYQKSDEADETTSFAEVPPTPLWTPPLPPPEWKITTGTINAIEAIAPHVTPEPAPEPPQTGGSRLDEIRRLADRGKSGEAARCCENLLKTDKLNPSIHLFHALVLEQMGKDEDAEAALRRAIYLDRNFVLPHYHFGLFLYKKGDQKGASRSLANAVRLLSNMDDARAFEEYDGISVAQLKELAKIHLEAIRG